MSEVENEQPQPDAQQHPMTQDELKAEQARIKSIVLDHYHCTFFLPIINNPDPKRCFPAKPLADYKHEYNNSQENNSEQERQADAQAYHFFTPSIRNILFDQGKPSRERELEPMREWRLPKEKISHWQLTLHKNSWAEGGESDPLNQQQVMFESVKLYRYFNGNYVLAFRVTPEVLKILQDFRENEIIALSHQSEYEGKTRGELIKIANEHYSLFKKDSDAQYFQEFEDDPLFDKYQYLQLEAWLRFTRLTRQLYPSFTEQGEEGKIAKLTLNKGKAAPVESFGELMQSDFPASIGKQFSPVVRNILLEFFGTNDYAPIDRWLNQELNLYDDRMFISVAYSLAGKQHDERTLSIINTLTATTDRVSDVWSEFDNLPYSPDAMEHYLSGCQFDFWKDIGGTYSYTDMVNAYVSRGGDFRDMIAPVHIPAIYDRMAVQALFYQASLRYYDHAITCKTSLLVSDNAQENASLDMTELLGNFIRFTNQYWFAEVTNQMQGKEIFKQQLQGLNVNSHFEQLQDEINRTNDYVHAKHERRQARKADRLTLLGLLIAIIALVPVFNDIFKPEPSLWTSLALWMSEALPETITLSFIWERGLLSGIMLTVFVILGWLVARFFSSRKG